MARGSNPFQIADAGKRSLTNETARRIRRLYQEASDDLLFKYGMTIGDESLSGQLRNTYYSKFRKELDKSIANLTAVIEKDITWATYTSAQLPIEASKFIMNKSGLSMDMAFASVPDQVVGNLISGSLYKGDWTLSQALWQAGNKTKTDVQRIIAKGLAENLSTKEISHSLEQYLVPGARKPWDWSKVYPGTAAKVDYNAQRLARTMIQHSYEQALIESTQDNPWVNGIVWHSAHSSRVCEICAERDGQIYAVKDLPLDHPNGMCFFEPAMDDMSKIGEDLAAWVNGDKNAGIDNYIATAYGYNPNSTKGKSVVEAVKQATKPNGQMSLEEKTNFIENNLSNLIKRISLAFDQSNYNASKRFMEKLLTLDDDQLRFLSLGDEYLTRITGSGSAKEAFFSPFERSITYSFRSDVAPKMNNRMGKVPWSTFFHEYGHLMDDALGKPISKFRNGSITAEESFGKKLYSSLEKEYNNLLNDEGKIDDFIRRELAADDASGGIQDIISGLSLNKNRIIWGHDTSYWTRHGKDEVWKEVASETMANFNDAWANERSRNYVEKYFPESYKLWKEEMMKYVDTKFS